MTHKMSVLNMAEYAEEPHVEAKHTEAEAKAEPGLTGMLLRDLALVFGALSLWAAADTWYVVTGLWFAMVVAVGDAILVGLLLAALAHEWGHYLGAVRSDAKAQRVAPKGLSLFRFDFDYQANSHHQFHMMTLGGHILHWSMLLLLVVALPLDTLPRIALVSAVFAFVVFATFIEYNITKDTRAGADPGERLAALSADDFRHATVVGGIAGLFAMAALS